MTKKGSCEIRVGVTGLRDLTSFNLKKLKRSISTELEEIKKVNNQSIMLNSIAVGADQLCAEIGLSLGYELICPLPFSKYRSDFCGKDLVLFDMLLGKANNTFVVSDSSCKDSAYLDAGKYIVQNCDVLLAVWDGKPQTSICGTAAIIAYAKRLHKEVKTLPQKM